MSSNSAPGNCPQPHPILANDSMCLKEHLISPGLEFCFVFFFILQEICIFAIKWKDHRCDWERQKWYSDNSLLALSQSCLKLSAPPEHLVVNHQRLSSSRLWFKQISLPHNPLYPLYIAQGLLGRVCWDKIELSSISLGEAYTRRKIGKEPRKGDHLTLMQVRPRVGVKGDTVWMEALGPVVQMPPGY